MRAIVKRRIIDFLITYVGMTSVAIVAPWWIFILVVVLCLWNFYDGWTRFELELRKD